MEKYDRSIVFYGKRLGGICTHRLCRKRDLFNPSVYHELIFSYAFDRETYKRRCNDRFAEYPLSNLTHCLKA